MEDNLYPKINESLNSLVASNSEFKLNIPMKYKTFLLGKYLIEKKK